MPLRCAFVFLVRARRKYGAIITNLYNDVQRNEGQKYVNTASSIGMVYPGGCVNVFLLTKRIIV